MVPSFIQEDTRLITGREWGRATRDYHFTEASSGERLGLIHPERLITADGEGSIPRASTISSSSMLYSLPQTTPGSFNGRTTVS